MTQVVRRVVLGLLVVGLVVAAAVGYHLVTAEPEADGDGAEQPRSRTTGTTDDGWRVVAYDTVTLEVPPAWGFLDTSGCEFAAEHWGPDGVDPCSSGVGLWFYGSATFDPATGPGVHKEPPSDALPDGGWAGYVTRVDVAVYAVDLDRELVRRVLRSVSRD